MKKLLGLLPVLVLGSWLLGTTGCLFVVAASAGAAGGTVAYVRGDLESDEDATVDQVYNAALKVMADMEFATVSKKKDSLQGEIVARDAGDKKITIKFKSLTPKTTHVSIRVGFFGDERVSRLVYDKLKKRL